MVEIENMPESDFKEWSEMERKGEEKVKFPSWWRDKKVEVDNVDVPRN